MSASKKSVLRRDTTKAYPPNTIVDWELVKADDYDPPLIACPDKIPPFPPDVIERAMRRAEQLTPRQSPPPIPAGTSLDAISVDESTSEEEDRDDVDLSTTPAPEDAPTPTHEQASSTDSGERGSAVRLCQIPREPISNFCTTGFSLQFKARLTELLALAEFQHAATFREQVGIACDHLRSFKDGKRFSWQEIGKFMGNAAPSTIRTQWQKAQRNPRAVGRPRVISEAAYQMIQKMIEDGYSERKPVTYFEILDALQYRCKTSISSDTLRHIVRTLPGVKTVIGVPMEAERARVDPAEIDHWFDDLTRAIEGVPRKFIFNVDETGCSEYSDAHEIKVIVPDSHPDDTIPVPVNRHSKRASMVACIAADGYRMKPFIILERKTIETDIVLYGYSQFNVSMVHQENAFMTAALFDRWSDEVFFPSIEKRRSMFDYTGKVIVLMDGLGAHHTDAFLNKCGEKNIEVIFFVPHSSDQCQPLDLLTFALLKRHFSSSSFHRLDNPQSNKVVKMLSAFFNATTPHLNVEAFMRLGLIPYAPVIPGDIYLRVAREQAARVRRPGDILPDTSAPLGPEGRKRITLPGSEKSKRK
jgi:hypothetical protein